MSLEALQNDPGAVELVVPIDSEQGEGINDDMSAKKYALFKGREAKQAALVLREQMQLAVHQVKGLDEVGVGERKDALGKLSDLDNEAGKIANKAEGDIAGAAFLGEDRGTSGSNNTDNSSGNGQFLEEQRQDGVGISGDGEFQGDQSDGRKHKSEPGEVPESVGVDDPELRRIKAEISRNEQLLARHQKTLAECKARRDELQQEIDADPNNKRAEEDLFFVNVGIKSLEQAIQNVGATLDGLNTQFWSRCRERIRLNKENGKGDHPVVPEERGGDQDTAYGHVRARVAGGENFGGLNDDLKGGGGNVNAVARGEMGDKDIDTKDPSKVHDDGEDTANHHGDVDDGRNKQLEGKIISGGTAYAGVQIGGGNDTTGPNSENQNTWEVEYEARQKYETRLLDDINKIYTSINIFLVREMHPVSGTLYKLAQSDIFESVDRMLVKEYAPLVIELGELMRRDQLGQSETDTINEVTIRISQKLYEVHDQIGYCMNYIRKNGEILYQARGHVQEINDLTRLYYSFKSLQDKVGEAAVHYRKVSSTPA